MNASEKQKRVELFKPTYIADGALTKETFVSQGFMRVEIGAISASQYREKLEGKEEKTVATHAIYYTRRDLNIEKDWQVNVVSPPSDGRKFTVAMASPPNDARDRLILHCKERAK